MTTQTKPLSKKAQKAKDRQDAITSLHHHISVGDTVYTVLRHVSTSGMSRRISLFVIHDGQPINLDYWCSLAMEYRRNDRDGALIVGGCGMDMGFHLVYSLGRVLYGAGFGCIGKCCRSNDHFNGDRDYTPHYDGTPRDSSEVGKDLVAFRHWHNDGGYALNHKWM